MHWKEVNSKALEFALQGARIEQHHEVTGSYYNFIIYKVFSLVRKTELHTNHCGTRVYGKQDHG